MAAPLAASDVAAGIDLWITPADDPGTRAEIVIPAAFFGTLSDAVSTVRSFHGRTLVIDPDHPSPGPADTILERLESASLTVCGAAVTVPLRVAALHLESDSPLTVTYDHGTSPESWGIDVFLSKAAGDQPAGTVALQQSCDDGGTLESHFKVYPRFVFTRVSDGRQLVLDWNTYPSAAAPIEFFASGSWTRVLPADYPRTTVAAGVRVDTSGDGDWRTLPATTSDFIVGMAATPCSCDKRTRSDKSAATIGAALLLEQSWIDNHKVHPCSDTSTAFPPRTPLPSTGQAGPTVRRPRLLSSALRLTPVALLVLAAGTALPWRRKKPADRG